MTSKPKVNIIDDKELRQEIEKKTDLISQVELAKWAICVTKHVLPYLEKEFPYNEIIINGFKTNELRQVLRGALIDYKKSIENE